MGLSHAPFQEKYLLLKTPAPAYGEGSALRPGLAIAQRTAE